MDDQIRVSLQTSPVLGAKVGNARGDGPNFLALKTDQLTIHKVRMSVGLVASLPPPFAAAKLMRCIQRRRLCRQWECALARMGQ